jgi:hypothetical protein
MLTDNVDVREVDSTAVNQVRYEVGQHPADELTVGSTLDVVAKVCALSPVDGEYVHVGIL